MTDRPELPERYPDAPNFEAALQDALAQAEQLPGVLLAQIKPTGAEVIYQEVPGSQSVPFESWHTVDVRKLDPAYASANDPQAYLFAHQDALVDAARPHLVVRRQTQVLIGALRQSELQPLDLETTVRHAFDLLPSMATAETVHGHHYTSDVAHAITRRALDMAPEAAAQAFTLLANLHAQYVDQAREETGYVQNFTGIMVQSLERTTTQCGAEALTHEATPPAWRYDLSGRHNVLQNTLTAIDILDEAGLVETKFWQNLLRIPFASQSMELIELLTERLHGPRGSEIVAGAGMERSRLLENAVRGAFARASTHIARNKAMLEGIREVVTDTDDRSEVIALGRLIKLADSIMRETYPGVYSPLSIESSFADAATALSFFLEKTLRPEATAEEKIQANEETAMFLQLIKGIFRRLPVIRTKEDFALYYPGATEQEMIRLNSVQIQHGPRVADALWRQQLRNQRRRRINGPGYGLLS